MIRGRSRVGYKPKVTIATGEPTILGNYARNVVSGAKILASDVRAGGIRAGLRDIGEGVKNLVPKIPKYTGRRMRRTLPTLGSFKKGGKVKKTGKYKLHKGEVVVPAKKVSKMKKVMKSANPGDLFNRFNKKK